MADVVAFSEYDQVLYKATDYLMKSCTPLFLLCGLSVNILSAIIWYKLLRSSSASATVFLVAISVSNSVGLLQEPLVRFIYHWFLVDLRRTESFCKTTFILNKVSSCCSEWFVFGFCFERISRLLHIHTGNSYKRPLVFVLLVVVVSIVLAVHVIFTVNGDVIKERDVSVFDLSSALVCGVQTNKVFMSSAFFNFFWVDALTCILFPSTFILGCSMATLQMLYFHKRGNMTTFLTVQIPITRGDIELAKTALFIGITNIVCTTPLAIFKTQVDPIQNGAEELGYSITSVLFYVEYIIKVIGYCTFNSRFRRTLNVFCKRGTLLRRLSARSFRRKRPTSIEIDTAVELIEIHIERSGSVGSSPEAGMDIETSTEQLSSSKSFTGSDKFKFDGPGLNCGDCFEQLCMHSCNLPCLKVNSCSESNNQESQTQNTRE